MTKYIYIFGFVFLLNCSACIDDPIVTSDFLSDLGSENYRINGTLYLDVFDMDLSTLTYDYYIEFLADTLKQSASDLIEKINLANDRYFKANDSSFVLVLWYKIDKKVLVDNSYTSNVDTVILLGNITELKNLESYSIEK